MRLFVACDVSSGVSELARSLQSSLPGTLSSSFHITLKFLGECSSSVKDEVITRLGSLSFSSFSAFTSSVGIFGGRVVWLGVEPMSSFVVLHDKIDELLAGLFPVESDFVPHLTLSRIKGPVSLNLKPSHVDFVVSEVKLFESVLVDGKHIHRVLAVFPLKNPGQ